MPDAVKQMFRVSDNRSTLFKPLDAIFPGYEAPVVRHAADGERELVMMHWGFMLLQAGKAPRRVEVIGAHPHPTALVQSAAMASVKPPVPNYRPHLPDRVVGDGLLSPVLEDGAVVSFACRGIALAGHQPRHLRIDDPSGCR